MAMVGIMGVYSALAESAVFTIDPAQSSITLSGNVAGGDIKEQKAGSLTTQFSGTIRAEINPGTIQFTGGSQILAQNGGDYEPGTGGASGTAPANYGGVATLTILIFQVQAKAAVRNIQLDALSGSLALSDGSFDSNGLLLIFPTNATSVMDYRSSVKSGAAPLAGYSTNQITTVATLTTVGPMQTLTIPVNATHYFALNSPNDSQLTLKGQLVATRSAAPALRFLGIKVENQTVTVQWQSSAGKKYQVESSSDLKVWTQRIPEVTASSDTSIWSAPVAGLGEFFRISE